MIALRTVLFWDSSSLVSVHLAVPPSTKGVLAKVISSGIVKVIVIITSFLSASTTSSTSRRRSRSDTRRAQRRTATAYSHTAGYNIIRSACVAVRFPVAMSLSCCYRHLQIIILFRSSTMPRRHRTTRQDVIDKLRQRIETGQYRPGARLPTTQQLKKT